MLPVAATSAQESGTTRLNPAAPAQQRGPFAGGRHLDEHRMSVSSL
jgi:hypothetical protein